MTSNCDRAMYQMFLGQNARSSIANLPQIVAREQWMTDPYQRP